MAANLGLQVKYSAISALVFFIVANPELYKLTQWMFGRFFKVAQPMGAATLPGLLLHTAVFFFAILGLMMVPGL
jgi:hypothetical protein